MKALKTITNLILILLFPAFLFAQNGSVSGKVISLTKTGAKEELVGVNVYWAGTTTGAVTDVSGNYQLDKITETTQLVFSYIGFEKDTFETIGLSVLNVTLKSLVLLDQVDITHRKQATQISILNPLKVETLNEKELQKAACCNLSESFETSPSVDVSFTDAVTGTRQIQMLGLAGPYTQITRENIPDVRGLSSLYGLVYTPGTWVESIQLNKGTGSVVNGFESIAGQINIELQKPEEADRLYLNGFANQEGRLELNANVAHKFKNKKWSTAVLLHANELSNRIDHNDDGFLDVPLSNQFIGLNRWKYVGDKGLRLQLGVKATYLDKVGGQKDFDPDKDIFSPTEWGMNVNMQRFEGWAKIGWVFKDISWKSMGLQLSAVDHTHESYFGSKEYDAKQNSLYANFIYQSIIGNTYHVIKAGASLQYDDYKESLMTQNFDRTEITPGVYGEYTNTVSDKISAVAGLRADYHNHYGAFLTPRLHLRYAPTVKMVFRASAGRGQRTSNVIADNMGYLASSRNFVIKGDGSDKPYGLNAEVAWNYGINATQIFELNEKEGTVSIDFYRTDFENQIVVDIDQSTDSVLFYNLSGDSYSNSVQLQVNYELLTRLDVRLAYRWYDVQTKYTDGVKSKPLVAANRAFMNLGYETPSSWKFDYTLNWQGSKRIPSTESNPAQYQLASKSPDFILMNTQVTKTWSETFDVYIGVENLLDYKQDDPIIASNDPFSSYFDSSLIWGPIFGRNIYMGVRYKIK